MIEAAPGGAHPKRAVRGLRHRVGKVIGQALGVGNHRQPTPAQTIQAAGPSADPQVALAIARQRADVIRGETVLFTYQVKMRASKRYRPASSEPAQTVPSASSTMVVMKAKGSPFVSSKPAIGRSRGRAPCRCQCPPRTFPAGLPAGFHPRFSHARLGRCRVPICLPGRKTGHSCGWQSTGWRRPGCAKGQRSRRAANCQTRNHPPAFRLGKSASPRRSPPRPARRHLRPAS